MLEVWKRIKEMRRESQNHKEVIRKRLESYEMVRIAQKKGMNSLDVTIPTIFTEYLGWHFKDGIRVKLEGNRIA